jgi:hypothetical protein
MDVKHPLWEAWYKQPCPVKGTSRSLPWRGLGKLPYHQTHVSLSCLMYKLGVLEFEPNMQRLRTQQSHNSRSFNSPILPLPQLLRNQSAFRYGVVSITSQCKTAGRPPLSFHVEVAAFLDSTAACHSTPTQFNCQVQINWKESNFRIVMRRNVDASKAVWHIRWLSHPLRNATPPSNGHLTMLYDSSCGDIGTCEYCLYVR